MPRQRARRVEHLDQPLERQLRHAHRPQGCRLRTRPSSSPKPGLPDVSVRSTSVLTKNPTRSSSAASLRPAIGLPIAMSVPAPSRVSSAASPACSTMNRLAPAARASAASPRCSSASMRKRAHCPPRWLDTAGRGRSAGSSICSGSSGRALLPERQAAARSRCRRRPPRPAPPAATACSRRTAPAAPAARPPLPSQPRPVQRRQVPQQRTQRPAVAGDVMQHQQQHVVGRRAPSCEQMRPQRQLAAPDRSRGPTAAVSAAASSASADARDRKPDPRRRRRHHLLPRHPRASGNTVRRLSCRATRSHSAPASAARSSAPVSRTASGIA